MLKELGVEYVIIGHSERRQYFGETDETVNKRVKAALAAGFKPIVCIGEMLEERESGKTEKVLFTQLEGGLAGLTKEDMANVVIAGLGHRNRQDRDAGARRRDSQLHPDDPE